MIKIFTLLFLYLPFTHTGDPNQAPVDNAVELIKSGNIRELAKKFAPTVEITLLNDENIYTAAQAEVLLTNFFKNNPVKAITVVHRVNSNANFKYAVLSLTTSTGTYRASVSLKLTNGQFLLNELKIETDKKE